MFIHILDLFEPSSDFLKYISQLSKLFSTKKEFIIQMPEYTSSVFTWLLLFFLLALPIGLIYPPLILFWTQTRTRTKAVSFCVFGMLLSLALAVITADTDAEFSIFGKLFFLSFVFGIIGLIAPGLVIPLDRYKNRRISSLIYFSMAFLSTLGLIWVDKGGGHEEVYNGKNNTRPATQYSSNSNETENLEKIIPLIVWGWSDTNLPKLRMFNIANGIDGGYNIYIEINAQEDSGWQLWYFALVRDMADTYKELYTSGYNIRIVKIAGYTALDDVNGYRHEVPIWITEMDKKTASKINWNADEYDLRDNIIPGRWTTVFAFPPMQKYIDEN